MEYYLAVKRNAILAHAMKYINLENIVLSQSQKAMTGFYLHETSRIGKFIKTESKLGLGVEGIVNRYAVSFFILFFYWCIIIVHNDGICCHVFVHACNVTIWTRGRLLGR